jgi:hypothetical protein
VSFEGSAKAERALENADIGNKDNTRKNDNTIARVFFSMRLFCGTFCLGPLCVVIVVRVLML